MQPYEVYDTSRDAVVAVTTPASFTVPVTISPGARLLSAVAVPNRVWTSDVTATAAPIHFRIRFESGNAEPVILYERTIDIGTRPADRRWFDFGRDLGALAGRSGSLRFEASLDRNGGAPGTLALWAPPEIVDCGGAGAASVLLITIDALRADHLGSAGYGRPTSPYLDRFAAAGTRFAAAFSGAPKTVPSIPQILTGRFFFHHRETRGVELLRAVGTGTPSRAIVNNPYVASWLAGERPGFATLVKGDLDARAITAGALRWLTAAGRCRTALYLHYLDTHTPYHAPRRFARRFIDRTAKTTVGLTFADVAGAWRGQYGPVDRRRIADLYDGSIAWTDRQIGRLLRGLARRGLTERTIVVVSADHGEELWDHGHFFHGQSLYDELLHVPLLVHVPGGAPGRVVADLVASVDIVPTVLDAGGLHGATGADGVSLLSLVRPPVAAPDGQPPHPVVYATVSNAEPRCPPRQAVRSPTMKVIHNVEDGRVEVYDLTRDPGEQRNLGPAAPGAADLITTLDAFRHRLDGRGMQLRVRSNADQPVAYVVQLATDPPAPIVEVDRVGLERGDRITIGEHSSALSVNGTLEPGDEDQMRMDVLAATGALRVNMTIDGRPAPPGTLRLGAAEKIEDGRVDLADPSLAGAPATSPAASTMPPVVVSLWRAATANAQGEIGVDFEAVPLDRAARERLRALGYVE